MRYLAKLFVLAALGLLLSGCLLDPPRRQRGNWVNDDARYGWLVRHPETGDWRLLHVGQAWAFELSINTEYDFSRMRPDSTDLRTFHMRIDEHDDNGNLKTSQGTFNGAWGVSVTGKRAP